ncbi:helix-turn-helix domain-containing protein [Bacillus sp. ISL-47]|uniref:helix-turn-helix domain-containing protein n=1 Tax=Bacillus sp. ISL-47 TaxID=2819130 RepID=UPI001BE8E062|nr:helix-turn-helix domain-containing protein [Bacillus sp. ISL-47]
MIIYKATNTVNGKVYIGLTSKSLTRRVWEHRSKMNSGGYFHFHHALRKYGFEAFTWDVIDSAIFYGDLKEKEKYWIAFYDSFNNGYNSTLGGDGTIGYDGRKGEKNHNSLITDEQAKEIVDLLRKNIMSFKEIAEKVGTSIKTVQHINYGDAWTHVYEGDPPCTFREEVWGGGKGEQFVSRVTVTEAQVIEIKRLLAEKVPAPKIAKQFNVRKDVINHIKYKQSWAWLKTEYDDLITTGPRSKLNENQVREIKKLLKKGISQSKIADQFNVQQMTISKISQGKSWKHVSIDD